VIDHYQTLSLAAMFMIGLLGSGHCIGMCGGIATGLGFGVQRRNHIPLVIGYNLGRVSSYTLAGALVATLGYWASSYLYLGLVLRILAGIILILMGLYLADWWRILVKLEKAGLFIWRYIQPFGKRLMPVTHTRQAFLLGMLWGWLPCGLVYAALAYAATATSTAEGAFMMAAFGLGTTPSMVLGGVFSSSIKVFLQARMIRRAMGVVLIFFGALMLLVTASHMEHNSSANTLMHQHHKH
jgi:uncharacterized protein